MFVSRKDFDKKLQQLQEQEKNLIVQQERELANIEPAMKEIAQKRAIILAEQQRKLRQLEPDVSDADLQSNYQAYQEIVDMDERKYRDSLGRNYHNDDDDGQLNLPAIGGNQRVVKNSYDGKYGDYFSDLRSEFSGGDEEKCDSECESESESESDSESDKSSRSKKRLLTHDDTKKNKKISEKVNGKENQKRTKWQLHSIITTFITNSCLQYRHTLKLKN